MAEEVVFQNDPRPGPYLPPGRWLGFFDGVAFEGPGWSEVEPAEIPAVLLVREGAEVPLALPAQPTGELDWADVRSWQAPVNACGPAG